MHSACFRYLALILLLAATAGLASASPYQEILDASYAAEGPGATAIVVRDGEVLFRGARGHADLELGVELRPEHVFRIGSITKQFTAVAILQLAEQEKLSLDDEITRFLPDYPTHGHRITIEQLLSHTSGVFSYTSIPGHMQGGGIREDLSTEELIDVFDETTMEFTPGERWSYSNSGYVLLGAIIEKASEMSYPDYVEKHLFEPLGMENSHYGGRQLIERRVKGYDRDGEGFQNAPFLSMTQPHAAGSLLSTVDDLARWNAAVMGGEVVSTESVAKMTRKFTLNDGDEVDYGLGYQLTDFRGQPMIHHGGGIFGFVTHALWLPESKIFVAVLSNSPSNAVSPTQVSSQLAAEALGRPFKKFSAIEVDEKTLADYVGVYQVEEDSTRSVLVEDGALYTQRSGSNRFEIKPHAEDAFFYPGSFTHLKFVRDDEGKVTAMHFFPDGAEQHQVAERVSDMVEVAEERSTVEVSPELYDLWAGTYQIAPGFHLEIRREGDRLISQATGQGAIEIHPASAHRYFVREVQAELEFDPGPDGRAQALTLFQGGQEIRAERVED